ncbi:MAG: DUF4834 family protein [Pedobacter sp.]|nr:MAG: DUF4834 family protein [Pedobacter sp.]
MAIINFIIITILVLWVIRLLFRLILPLFLSRLFGKMQNQAQQHAQQQYTNRNRKPEGSITIDYVPKKEKKGNADKLGDFVDFEEVK